MHNAGWPFKRSEYGLLGPGFLEHRMQLQLSVVQMGGGCVHLEPSESSVGLPRKLDSDELVPVFFAFTFWTDIKSIGIHL